MKKFLIFALILKFSNAQFELKVNNDCKSKFTGQNNGVCLEAKDCPSFKQYHKELKICSFDRKVPIVCCPKPLSGRINERRISAKKCDEYTIDYGKKSNKNAVRLGDDVVKPTFVGGIKTRINEFPHMSAVGWLELDKIVWRCGGSLISEKFVLSAAHCVSTIKAKPDVIRIGDQDLSDDDDGASPQEFNIKNIIIHPNYRRRSKYHDIVLFELDRVVRFDASVSPACLPQEDENLIPQLTQAMGWGQTSFGGQTSSKLLKGFLSVISNIECNKYYEDDTELSEGIISAQICAWDPNGKKDTCLGDSGGPLLVTKTSKDIISYHEIVGVTSFGKFCAAGVPGVYVKVFSYLDWIESVVWKS